MEIKVEVGVAAAHKNLYCRAELQHPGDCHSCPIHYFCVDYIIVKNNILHWLPEAKAQKHFVMAFVNKDSVSSAEE